jgi:hypothetical protein
VPRYHFDLVDSTTVADQGGRIVADDVMAADVADRLAQQLFDIRKELRGKIFTSLSLTPRARKFTALLSTNRC